MSKVIAQFVDLGRRKKNLPFVDSSSQWINRSFLSVRMYSSVSYLSDKSVNESNNLFWFYQKIFSRSLPEKKKRINWLDAMCWLRWIFFLDKCRQNERIIVITSRKCDSNTKRRLLFPIRADEIVELESLGSSRRRQCESIMLFRRRVNVPHCPIPDWSLCSFDLFAAERREKNQQCSRSRSNGNPLKFIDFLLEIFFTILFSLDQCRRRKKQTTAEQVLDKQSISVELTSSLNIEEICSFVLRQDERWCILSARWSSSAEEKS